MTIVISMHFLVFNSTAIVERQIDKEHGYSRSSLFEKEALLKPHIASQKVPNV